MGTTWEMKLKELELPLMMFKDQIVKQANEFEFMNMILLSLV